MVLKGYTLCDIYMYSEMSFSWSSAASVCRPLGTGSGWKPPLTTAMALHRTQWNQGPDQGTWWCHGNLSQEHNTSPEHHGEQHSHYRWENNPAPVMRQTHVEKNDFIITSTAQQSLNHTDLCSSELPLCTHPIQLLRPDQPRYQSHAIPTHWPRPKPPIPAWSSHIASTSLNWLKPADCWAKRRSSRLPLLRFLGGISPLETSLALGMGSGYACDGYQVNVWDTSYGHDLPDHSQSARLHWCSSLLPNDKSVAKIVDICGIISTSSLASSAVPLSDLLGGLSLVSVTAQTDKCPLLFVSSSNISCLIFQDCNPTPSDFHK